MKVIGLFVAIIIGAMGCTTAAAASGDIDPAFGGQGTGFLTTMPWDHVLIQPDDRLIQAETIRDQTNTYILIRRLSADGIPETGFGTFFGAGIFAIPGTATIAALAMQSNGQILVTGSSNGDFYVLRFNSNGYVDTSFGSGGIAVTDFAGNSDIPQSVAERSDGKIVVVGSAVFGTATKFAVARYNSNGTADTTFSGNGRSVAGWGQNYNVAMSAALLPGGKIVVGGTAQVGGGDNFAMAQFNNNGSLDSTFGTGGLVDTDFGTASVIYRVIRQADGRIVAVGTGYNMARYDKNGGLDPTFGSGGKVSPQITVGGCQSFSANDFTMQSDGKLVVVATCYLSGSPYASIERFYAAGGFDTSFGNNGTVIFGNVLQFTDVGLQSTGKIVAGGYFGLARFLP